MPSWYLAGFERRRGPVAAGAGAEGSKLLLEDASYLLLESGDKILLET